MIEQRPEYEKVDLLRRMVEPDRMFTFRVCWQADDGSWHTNTGWRCQFNGSIGPYKGGLRFQKNVYEGIIKFLAFEQTFKNSLTGLPTGGAKGGSRIRPEATGYGAIYCLEEVLKHDGDTIKGKRIAASGVKYYIEVANMPTTNDALNFLRQQKRMIVAPSKAVNAGGVGVSALEMAQNSERLV